MTPTHLSLYTSDEICAACRIWQQRFTTKHKFVAMLLGNAADKIDHLTAEFCAATEEIKRLRAAIATPEVYAGVVTEVLEAERDRAIQELREAPEIIAKFPDSIAELKRENVELRHIVEQNKIKRARRHP